MSPAQELDSIPRSGARGATGSRAGHQPPEVEALRDPPRPFPLRMQVVRGGNPWYGLCS